MSNRHNKNNFKFDSKILSSSHINFLFGAGVNGDAFPKMKDFIETVSLLESLLKRKIRNFENDIGTLSKPKQEKVFKLFLSEFHRYDLNTDYNAPSIQNLEKLFQVVNKLIIESENRTLTSKQVNIYTLNYDDIIENVLKKIGVMINVISSSNIDIHDKFFDLVGYDYNLKRYIPTFLVSKIHGDISNPIFPNRKKYDETLESKRFEVLFKMKSQLSRINSILIVVGYSGKDNHINRLIKDCVLAGLTIYWFRYDEDEEIPVELNDRILVIDQVDVDRKINLSLMCSNMLEEIWGEQLEE